MHGNTAGGLVCSLSEQMFKSNLVKKINKFLNGNRYSLLHVTDVLGKIPEEYHEGNAVFVLSDEVKSDFYVSIHLYRMLLEQNADNFE